MEAKMVTAKEKRKKKKSEIMIKIILSNYPIQTKSIIISLILGSSFYAQNVLLLQ